MSTVHIIIHNNLSLDNHNYNVLWYPIPIQSKSNMAYFPGSLFSSNDEIVMKNAKVILTRLFCNGVDMFA